MENDVSVCGVLKDRISVPLLPKSSVSPNKPGEETRAPSESDLLTFVGNLTASGTVYGVYRQRRRSSDPDRPYPYTLS